MVQMSCLVVFENNKVRKAYWTFVYNDELDVRLYVYFETTTKISIMNQRLGHVYTFTICH